MDRPTGYEPLYTLKPVTTDVWVVDGGWIRFYGLFFPTRMTVIRLVDGSIWVHSPIADQDGLSDAVANLGPVRYLVAPNWIHYAYIPDWQSRFPEATTWGSPGVVDRAKSQKVDLVIDSVLTDVAPSDWNDQIDQRLADSDLHREVVFFHRISHTLILTDLIENFELENMPWWAVPLLKLARVCHPDGRMPLDMAASFWWKGNNHLKDLVTTMIEWGPERIILAHGRWYERDGVAELKRAFRDVI